MIYTGLVNLFTTKEEGDTIIDHLTKKLSEFGTWIATETLIGRSFTALKNLLNTEDDGGETIFDKFAKMYDKFKI